MHSDSISSDQQQQQIPMAPEHWSIEKKQREWDIELRNFREKQRKRLTTIRVKSKRKVSELHERIYFSVRWANPKLPNAYQNIVNDYCDHLLSAVPDSPYPKWSLLVVYQNRLLSGPTEKASMEVQRLLQRLSKLVLSRDEALVNTMVELEEKTERMTIEREGTIRWHMENTMKCARDDYWTIWYLARRGLVVELESFITGQSFKLVPPTKTKPLSVATETSEAPKAVEAPEVSKAVEAPDASKAPDVSKAPEALEASDASKASKASKAPEASEVSAALEASKAPEASEVVGATGEKKEEAKNMINVSIKKSKQIVDVDMRDPDFGYTALHYACKSNQFSTFKLLLSYGANERAIIEEDGRTPLHLAACYGTREMVLELLAVGAVYEAVDYYGATALDLARQNKNFPVVKTLENWTELVPVTEVTPRAEEDLSSVPEEFMSTPYDVLMSMSPALRVITSRLEGPIDSFKKVIKQKCDSRTEG